MCDPISMAVAGAGASMAGNYLNYQNQIGNQKRAINAGNAANVALANTESNLQKTQAQPIFDKAISTYQGATPATNLATSQNTNGDFIASNAPSAAQLSNGGITAEAPQVVKDAAATSLAGRMGKIATSNQALGNLTGYDTNNQNNARSFSDAENNMGVVSDFAKGDAQVGSAQRNADITNSQRPASPWGDLLQGAGQLAAFGGGKGWFGAGTSLPTGPLSFTGQSGKGSPFY